MGLFDAVVGSVLGSVQQAGGVAGLLGRLLADDGGEGGLPALVRRFEQAGLGDAIASWIGTGQNQPVSPEQLGQALGGERLADLARQFQLDPQQLGGLLSEHLPGLIDRLTPQGEAPAGGLGNAEQLLGTIGDLLSKR